jgi:hypothetical protein
MVAFLAEGRHRDRPATAIGYLAAYGLESVSTRLCALADHSIAQMEQAK